MDLKIKYLITVGVLMFWCLSKLYAQNLDHYFTNEGVKTLAKLAHPTNNFQGGRYTIYNNYILVEINYQNYKTRLRINRAGNIFTEIDVLEDNDIVSPFLAIQLIKDIFIKEVQEKTVEEDIVSSLEVIFNKAVQDMSGIELTCIILTLEYLGNVMDKNQINDVSGEVTERKEAISGVEESLRRNHNKTKNPNTFKDGDVINPKGLDLGSFKNELKLIIN